MCGTVGGVSDAAASSYTFGDDQRAIERLDLLARLFAPGTRALLDRWGGRGAGTALDLGCGPGHTSELVASRCQPRRLVALDASPAMVRAAARRLRDRAGAEARVADVTTPLPGAPVDLIHARFLLTHLRDPCEVVARWCAQLGPSGRVLVDEVDRIESTAEPFRTYLDHVTAMLRDSGKSLYAGRLLHRHRPPGVCLLGEQLVAMSQPTAAVARMFSLNLAVWRRGAWAVANRSAAELDELAGALDELTRVPAGRAGEILWTHRQLVWEHPRD